MLNILSVDPHVCIFRLDRRPIINTQLCVELAYKRQLTYVWAKRIRIIEDTFDSYVAVK